MLTAAVTFVAAGTARAATFNISNGSVAALINAINKANSNSQDDTIELAANGTYTLTRSVDGANGLPVIGADGGKRLTIHGNGATIQRDNAAQYFRILECAHGANASISGVTLRSGLAYNAAAIYNDGTLALNQCNVIGNGTSGDSYGSDCGAIYNSASLSITDSSINNNLAGGEGGAICNDGSLSISKSAIDGNGSQYGAFAIVSSGTLTISDSSIDSNHRRFTGGSAIVSNGSATITNSSISGNEGDEDAPSAISNGGSMQLSNCAVNDNRSFDETGEAISNGNTLTMNGCTVDGNIGGGLVNGGTLTISNSTLSGNYTAQYNADGAAILNGGSATVTNCTFSGNHADGDIEYGGAHGGAIFNGGSLTVRNSTFSDNVSSAGGGAIYNSVGSATVTNCTLSKNRAGDPDYAFDALGGAIFNGRSLTVTNSTFSDNVASAGSGAIYNSGTSALTKLANTILKANSTDANLGNDNGGNIVSLGYNLSNENGSGFLTAMGDQINIDPMLGPSQELLFGSPAIDAGDPNFNPNSFSPPLLYDQRGAARVAHGRIDIGAVEFQSQKSETEKLTVTAFQGATPSIISDSKLSGGAGTQLLATASGQYVTYTVPVSSAGTYNVKVGVKTGPKRGIFQMYVGGAAQGQPQDEYTSAVAYGVRDLGTVTFFSGGNNAFKFLVTGKNANSGGYGLGLDYVELIPTTPPVTQRLETENLNVQVLSGAPHSVMTDANLSGGAGTQLLGAGAGQYVTYGVPVPKAGTYQVKVRVKTGPKRGIFRLSIDGVNQGQAQDEYTSTVGYGVRDLGTVTFFADGNKDFKFLITGHNASSGGYGLGFDYIELVPTNRQETESLKVASITPVPPGYPSAKWFGLFNASAASAGAGTYFNATAPSNYITYTLPVVSPGTYHVRVGLQTKPDKGIFQLAINGLSIGQPQDAYNPSVTYGVRDLGTVSLSVAGNYAFTFTVAGKNASSSGYTLAFDYIELIPAP